MVFIDCHCHLDLCKDIKKLINNAKKENVKIILSCGTNIKSNREVLKLAEEYKEIKPCLGVYPIDALELSEKELNDELKFIEINKEKITAIGEVGIDLKFSQELENQKNILIKFINLSKKINKPLIVHSRKAEKEVIEILEKEKSKKVIMHCFSGKLKLIQNIIQNGWMITIPSSVKYNDYFKKVISSVPIENLLCETDSPFLHPDRLKNNEPKNVTESYKEISRIKNISLSKVETIIEKNYRLFCN